MIVNLSQDEVIVIYVETSRALPGSTLGLAQRLTSAEVERAARFAFERDRYLYIIAHALLHHALSWSLGEQPLSFAVNAFGKPRLRSADGDPLLRFNLSRTEGLAVCAVSRAHEVGIDSERIDPQ